jgi:hypothetical protein
MPRILTKTYTANKTFTILIILDLDITWDNIG